MRLKELEHWLTAAEAARELGISRQAMNKRCEEGKHRGVKTHHGWLVDPDSVQDSPKRIGERGSDAVGPAV
jgi:DNA-binding Lrp family transcriptional regulator